MVTEKTMLSDLKEEYILELSSENTLKRAPGKTRYLRCTHPKP